MQTVFDAIKEALTNTADKINEQLGTRITAFTQFNEENRYEFGLHGSLASIRYNGEEVEFVLRSQIEQDMNIFDSDTYNEIWALMTLANYMQQLHVRSRVSGTSAMWDQVLEGPTEFEA